MPAPADRQHIPMAFLNAIWDEFDKVTWAPDARPVSIRMAYHTAVSNAVKTYYSTPSVQGEEGASSQPDSLSPSTTGGSNE